MAVCSLVFAASIGSTVAHLRQSLSPLQPEARWILPDKGFAHVAAQQERFQCACTPSAGKCGVCEAGHVHEGVHEGACMIVPAAPPQTMELAASPRMARKPSPEGATDAGLPGTTLLSACMTRPGAFRPPALSLSCFNKFFDLIVSNAQHTSSTSQRCWRRPCQAVSAAAAAGIACCWADSSTRPVQAQRQL